MPTLVSTGQLTIVDTNDGYSLTVTGGTRAVVYNGSGTTPSPATSSAFGFTLYKGNTSITTGLTYSWTTGGIMSGSGTASTFTPTFAANHITTESFVQLAVTETATGLVFTQKIPIVATRTGATGDPGSNGTSSLSASITGGNRSFFYNQYGQSPTPASSGTFAITLYYGSSSVTPASYSWSCSGIFSGTGTGATFSPTLSTSVDFSAIAASSVTCTVTYNPGSGAISTTVSIPIAASARGARAPVQAYYEANSWSDTTANSAIVTMTGDNPIFGDRVTMYAEPKWIPIKGAYNSANNYLRNDIVIYNGEAYILKESTASNKLPTDATTWAKYTYGVFSFKDAYSASTTYVLNDVVYYASTSKYYKLIVSTSTGVLPTNTTNWAEYLSTISDRGSWAFGTSYAVNNIVKFPRIALNTEYQIVSIIETTAVVNGDGTANELYTSTPLNYKVGDPVLISEISGTTEFAVGTIYYVYSFSPSRLKLSTNSALSSFVDISDTTFTLKVHRVNIPEFICISANSLTSTGVARTDEQNAYLTFSSGTGLSKVYASGSWTEAAAYFDGNVIVTGTLSVDALKSGSSNVGNTRGTFGLGGNDILFRRKATGRFTADAVGGIPFFTVNTRKDTSTDWAHGQISGTLGNSGYAYVGYSAADTYGNYRSLFGGAFSTFGSYSALMLEGNVKSGQQLTNENLAFLNSEVHSANRSEASAFRYFQGYTKVFNHAQTTQVSTTSGIANITILNHGLSVGMSIKFNNFTSGTNFVENREYIVSAVPTANTIQIANTSDNSAVTPDVTSTSIRAYVNERVIRTVTLISGSNVVTTSGAHNLGPDMPVKFSNIVFGTNFKDQRYRVLTVLSTTTFTVCTYDGSTAVTFDGTTTYSGLVFGHNPELAAVLLCSKDAHDYANTVVTTFASRHVLYSNYEKATDCITDLGTKSNNAVYGMYTNKSIYANGGTFPFTGKHTSVINSDEIVEAGDILVDIEIKAKLDISNVICKQSKSTMPNQKGVIGIYSGEDSSGPLDLVGYEYRNEQKEDGTYDTRRYPKLGVSYTLSETERYYSMNSVGEGQINVCGENGPIEIGDLIVTSSIPGKGMKQSDDIIRSYTVAKSRENVTFDYPGQIKQIACIYLCG